MNQPVAIRRRVTPLDHAQRLAFIAWCNRSAVATLSAAEQASIDAAVLALEDVEEAFA
jgi:hypothetical protein